MGSQEDQRETFSLFSMFRRVLVFIVPAALVLVLTQSVQIFPGAAASLFEGTERDPASLPAGVENSFTSTKDGERLELWKLPTPDAQQVAIVFHGNGAPMANFFPYQRFFQRIGLTSYGMDYRGYGKSTGWPSEAGLELDAEAVVEHVLRVEQITVDELVIVGVSIGSGPASYAAAKYSPRAVIFFSPFTSLPDVIRTVPVLGYLHPFSFYELPVAKNVALLRTSCVIITHGENDTVVPFEQGREVYESASVPFSEFIPVSGASHNDILFRSYERVAQALKRCAANS